MTATYAHNNGRRPTADTPAVINLNHAGRRVNVLQLRDKSIEVHHDGEAVARFSREQLKALVKRQRRAKRQLMARV